MKRTLERLRAILITIMIGGVIHLIAINSRTSDAARPKISVAPIDSFPAIDWDLAENYGTTAFVWIHEPVFQNRSFIDGCMRTVEIVSTAVREFEANNPGVCVHDWTIHWNEENGEFEKVTLEYGEELQFSHENRRHS